MPDNDNPVTTSNSPLTDSPLPDAAAPNNSKITNEYTYQPDVEDTHNYTSVLGENIYEFMSNAFFGEGGFKDGSYLIPHSRELFYDARRDGAFYKNFTQPIVNAMVNPIYAKYIKRSITRNGNPVEDGFAVRFLNDVDNNGTDMQGFMRDNAGLFATLHGITFVVVDNHKKTTKTVPQALENREFPYIYTYKASQLPERNNAGTLGWETDRFGNLQWITFYEGKKQIGKEKRKYYSYWDKDTFFTFWIDSNDSAVRIEIDRYDHNLGKIPVIPYFTGRRIAQRNMTPQPPLYDIAKINHTIFNKDSEIRDQERAQGFAVFYVSSSSPGSLNIGAHNVLYPPIESPFPPGFASPDPAILDGLVKNAAALRDDLFRIAEQKGVTATKTAKSGIALEWEFTAEDIILANQSKRAEAIEYKIMELFWLWTGETGYEYQADYPLSFRPRATSAELENIDKALLMSMPPKAQRVLKRKVFESIIEDEESPEIEAALLEFEQDMEPEVIEDDADDAADND